MTTDNEDLDSVEQDDDPFMMKMVIEAAPLVMSDRGRGVGAIITDMDTGATVQFAFPVTDDQDKHVDAANAVVHIGMSMDKIMTSVHDMLTSYFDDRDDEAS